MAIKEAVDKLLYPFWEDEEREQYNTLSEREEELENQKLKIKDLAESENLLSELEDIVCTKHDIRNVVLSRYSNSVAENQEQLFNDTKTILEATTKEDYLNYLDLYKTAYKSLEERARPEDKIMYFAGTLRLLKVYSVEGYKTFYSYLTGQLGVQIAMANNYNPNKKGIHPVIAELIDETITKWYERPEDFDIYSGVITDEDEKDLEDQFTLLNQSIINIIPKAIEAVEYPLDKINNNIWSMLQEAEEGQLAYKFNTSKSLKNPDSYIIYTIDFDNLDDITITKKLTAFDKRVYLAVSALYAGGNHIMSLNQIHKAMGNKTRPGSKQNENILTSLKKMHQAQITLDNFHEAKTYSNYKKYRYYGSLLPLEIVTETTLINNKVTDGAIHILKFPPLLAFAKERKQVTTIKIELLESPVSKTEKNLVIEDYLIDRIADIKRTAKTKDKKKGWNKILFSTLFDRCNITGATPKKRAKEAINRYLTHYQKTLWLKEFKINEDHIIIKP